MNTENNKLIAEFLGDTIEVRPYNDSSPDRNAFFYKHNGNLIFLCMDSGSDNALHEVWMREAAKLTFHKDWNTLMEVVEKIQDCQILSSVGMNVNIYNTVSEIKCRWSGAIISTGQGKTRIQALYYAVVEFIKWYNHQPK